MKVFIDTCIPMYAAGKEHSYRQSCREIILAAASGELEACTDTEVMQEILYRFYHIQRKDLGFRLFDSFAMVMDGSILSVTAHDMLLARQLAVKYTDIDLSPRDLVHLAVMMHNDISRIITTDKGFRAVEDITVIVP